MPSEDFTNYTVDLKEKDGKKTYSVHIVVNNADGDCSITKTNDADPEDVIEDSGNIDDMCLREDLLNAP